MSTKNDWQTIAVEACERVRDGYRFDSKPYNAADTCADAVNKALATCPSIGIAELDLLRSERDQARADLVQVTKVVNALGAHTACLKAELAQATRDRDAAYAEIRKQRSRIVFDRVIVEKADLAGDNDSDLPGPGEACCDCVHRYKRGRCPDCRRDDANEKMGV